MLSPDFNLKCPCGSDYMHFQKAFLYNGLDRYYISEYIEIDGCINKAKRIRDSIIVSYRIREPSFSFHYQCELCNRINEYSLSFHKGIVFFTLTDCFNKIYTTLDK